MIRGFPVLLDISGISTWINENNDVARWSLGQAVKFENKKIWLSSIEFDNEEDFLYCSLKYGIKLFNDI